MIQELPWHGWKKTFVFMLLGRSILSGSQSCRSVFRWTVLIGQKNFSVPITTKDKITDKRFIWEIKGVLIFFLNRKVPKESLGRPQILLLLMHALIHPTFMLIANGHLQRAYRPIGLWHLVHYKLILFI